MKRTFISVFLFGCFVLLLPPAVRALSPMVQYQDLVAGNGESGYEDGAFYSAQFNQPIGLALNADESVLYVADQKNNLIRAVLLKEKNRVITIAGTVDPGHLDGPLSIASFNQPKDLAFLPNNRIAVNDEGNHVIRLIDLNKGTVSTMAGGGTKAQTEGDALQVELGSIWNLVYCDKDRSLYFSQPVAGLLQKLDLESGKISTILKENTLLPHPEALCAVDGKIFAADQNLPQVYEVPLNETTASGSGPSLQSVGQAQTILALAGSGKSLYAYQADPDFPIVRLFPNPGPVSFVSVSGTALKAPAPGILLPAFRTDGPRRQAGFLFDPRSEDRFYITNLSQSFIATFRDCFNFPLDDVRKNRDGLYDLEYPDAKPPGTFRILLCGRSYIDYQMDDRIFENKDFNHEGIFEMTTLAKRMELELNTCSALEDNPVHFDVFNACYIPFSLLTESYYGASTLCPKYDIDLVLIMKDDREMNRSVNYLLMRPLGPEGIPVLAYDPEFWLKPHSDKFPSGEYHDFFLYLLSKKLLAINGPNNWSFDVNGILKDADARKQLMKILGRPLKLLKAKLDGMKTAAGKPRQLVFCYFNPGGSYYFTDELQRAFWRDMCQGYGITFLDLCDDFAALGMSYHPYSTNGDVDHFTHSGLNLFNEILLHELTSHKIIPTVSNEP